MSTLNSNKKSYLNIRKQETAPLSTKDIIKQVQKIYQKFDKGEIDHKGLRRTITEEVKCNTNGFETLMKTGHQDNKGFKNIIKSLGLTTKHTYHPTFTHEDIKNSTLTKFPRFIKEKEINLVKTPMHTTNNFFSHGETNIYLSKDKSVKEFVRKFTKGEINGKTFENSLRNKNINPEIEEINKHIKSANTGPVKFNELMSSVLKYKDGKNANDPSKIGYSFRKLDNHSSVAFAGEGKDE